MTNPHFVIRLDDDQQKSVEAESQSYMSEWVSLRQWDDLKRAMSSAWGCIDREYPENTLLRMPRTLKIDVGIMTADRDVFTLGAQNGNSRSVRCYPNYGKRFNFDSIAIRVRNRMLELKRVYSNKFDGLDQLVDSFPIPGLEDVAPVTIPDFIHDLRKQDTGLVCCW